VPLIGVLLRGAAALRNRMHDLSAQTAAVAAGAVGVAAVAAVAGGLALVPTHNPASRPTPAHVAQAAAAPPAAIVSGPLQSVLDGFVSGQAPRVSRPTAAQRAVKPLSDGSSSEGHAATANDPSSITILGLTVSTDLGNPLALLDLLK
jgi:hypothetical protein